MSTATVSTPRFRSASLAGFDRDSGRVRAIMLYEVTSIRCCGKELGKYETCTLTKRLDCRMPSRIDEPVSPVAPTIATQVLAM